jgi:CopG family transcriptional regulator, nickel-responsive regulator
MIYNLPMSENLLRFGVSIPEKLLEKFDSHIKKQGYENRSEAIRDLIRERLVEEVLEEDTRLAFGSITIVYDHHKSNIGETLNKLQHECFNEIISNVHVHADHDNCLEVLLLKGENKRIKEIADKIISLKGVKHGKLVLSVV